MPIISPALKQVVLLSIAIATGFPGMWAQQASAASQEISVTKPPLIDVDAMAARMKTHQDVYRKIRDEGLSAFVKGQSKPLPSPTDAQMKALIRIAAYLWVWGDFYGEGMWQQGSTYATGAMNAGVIDWLANMFPQEATLQSNHSAEERDAQRINFCTSQLLTTDYPAQLKMQACSITIGNLMKYKTEAHGDPSAPSFKMVATALEQWRQGYRQMIKEKWSHDLLYWTAANLLCVSQDDQGTLDLAIAEIDEDFNEVDAANPVKIALDGQYFVNAAWCARGSDWSNNVTDQGWRLFSERLAKADEILEAGYAKYPLEGEMARSMIDVELGQGKGRERMELWFQRAIKADPNDYDAYKGKAWYLQPRWHGSTDDILSFGLECVKTGNWSARLPLILPTAIADAADQDPTLYARDDIWKPIEKVYREYLSRYPNSIRYRTFFAKHAYDGGHKDIAKEQFNILLGNFDRDVLSNAEFMKINADLNTH